MYTRPIYPYPNVAKYKSGDPNDAANYQEVKGPAKVPQAFPNETVKLLGPDKVFLSVAQAIAAREPRA